MKDKAIHMRLELKLKKQVGGGYLVFSKEREQTFVNNSQQAERRCYFCASDRALTIISTLHSKEDWGCDLNIERLLHEGVVLQLFALHVKPDQDVLIRKAVWQRWWDPTYKPPLSELRDYLGSRVAFYFVFVSFYARHLLFIALVSIPVYTVYRVLQDDLLIIRLLWGYSFALVLWTTWFLESWKRRNALMNIKWGLNDYHQDSVDDIRAQYVVDMRVGFYCEGGFVPLADVIGETDNIDNNNANANANTNVAHNGSVHVPLNETDDNGNAIPMVKLSTTDLPLNPCQDPRISRNAKFQSALFTYFFVVLVGSLTFFLLIHREGIITSFRQNDFNSFATFVPGLLYGLLITAFDPIWRSVSLSLTRRENHRTNQLFENSHVVVTGP